MKVGFVGLGKLGLPVALAVESKGHKVYGYDIKKEIYAQIKNRKIDYKEQHANDLLKKTKIEIVELKKLIKLSDIIFVPIQTPHDKKYEGINDIPKTRKDFNYTYIKKGIKMIADELKKIKKKKIVIIISTVLPGTIRKNILPVTNKYTQIGYNPFFIAMGTTIDDFLYSEIILFGSDNKFVSEKAKNFYRTITNSPFFETTIENAELIKVVYNTYISTKIAFINSITEMCHRLPGTNIDEVTRALSLSTKRIISSSYLRGGMGDGGGCHPRDNIAMSYLAKKHNVSFNIFEAIMLQRQKYNHWLADLCLDHAKKRPVIILGKSFKPETNIKTGSPSIYLFNSLKKRKKDVFIWDPETDDVSLEEFMAINKLVNKQICYFIGTQHKAFLNVNFNKNSYVLDPFRYIKKRTGVKIIEIGEGGKI
mgnify:CR=1 FL=1|tara:strand:+ start:330 stop:1598 length:1269 start_codon:yes stop_codon:yes gene_type:complete